MVVWCIHLYMICISQIDCSSFKPNLNSDPSHFLTRMCVILRMYFPVRLAVTCPNGNLGFNIIFAFCKIEILIFYIGQHETEADI